MTLVTSRKMRSPLKVHGGKSYLARRIVSLFRSTRTYIEPFFGGGSVLLNKSPSVVEIAGDLEMGKIHFWETLQGQASKLLAALEEIPYTEDAWKRWTASDLDTSDPIIRAAAYMVRNRFSRGGLGKDFAWSDRLRGGQPGDTNAWDTIREEIPAIARRIQGVRFHNRDAAELIRENDSRDALIYCDPPYLHETRTAKKAYAYEMTTEEHAELLEVLVGCKAKVFLSGYASALYDSTLIDWKRHEFEIANHAGQGKAKQRRIECLWESP